MSNMKINKTIAGLFLLTTILVGTGCKKTLDINQDPNYPSYEQGNASLVFPAAVLATTGKVGGDLMLVGGIWSQYFTQSSGANQYTDIESYNMPPVDSYVNQSYDILFSNGLKNYQYVIDKSRDTSDWNFYLMGTVMKAYTAQVLVDLYDQIPYSEALQGLGNLTPKFDDGYSIYQSLLSEIDSALGKDFSARTNTDAGSQDLVFGGDISEWIKFANTLKLKIYLRMVNSHPDEAEAGITALYNSGAGFLDVSAGVTNFTNAPGLDNPLYEQNIRQLNTTTNLRASTTFVSWLKEYNDPRIAYYFGSANITSMSQGDYSNNLPAYQTAPVFAQSFDDPVHFISLAESYFLQAEADYRYLGGSNAKSLYEQGVEAAFADLGLDGSSFVAPGGAYEWGNEIEGGQALDPIAQIIRQKWASCAYGCHGIEAYFEKNRTGYPKTSGTYYGNDYVSGELVIGPNSVLPAGQLPRRFVFPYDETSRNKNAPAVVPSTTPVWWGQ